MLANKSQGLPPDLLIFTEEDMGESDTQFIVCGVLVEQFTDYFAALERSMKVGGNLLFRYRQGDAAAQVVPDVYVLEGESQEEQDLSCWSTWEHSGKAPALAIEVVSQTSRKDYALDAKGMLARYQELGVQELIRYDPLWSRSPRSQRRLLTHFARTPEGALVERPLDQPHLLKIDHLGVWLIHTGPRRLRLGIGSPGNMTLWPTRKERITAAERRAAAESERAAAESERAAAESERADRAESELRALREELQRLKG